MSFMMSPMSDFACKRIASLSQIACSRWGRCTKYFFFRSGWESRLSILITEYLTRIEHWKKNWNGPLTCRSCSIQMSWPCLLKTPKAQAWTSACTQSLQWSAVSGFEPVRQELTTKISSGSWALHALTEVERGSQNLLGISSS